jgi:hypothetical protein
MLLMGIVLVVVSGVVVSGVVESAVHFSGIGCLTTTTPVRAEAISE